MSNKMVEIDSVEFMDSGSVKLARAEITRIAKSAGVPVPKAECKKYSGQVDADLLFRSREHATSWLSVYLEGVDDKDLHITEFFKPSSRRFEHV